MTDGTLHATHVGRVPSTVALVATIAVSLAATGAPSAGAVTLTNNDRAGYRIEVRVRSVRRAFELQPGQSRKDFCKAGCIIRLNDSADSDYELEGSERVSIEGGLVYYDGEEVEPKAGTADEKAPKD